MNDDVTDSELKEIVRHISGGFFYGILAQQEGCNGRIEWNLSLRHMPAQEGDNGKICR